jgi:uncharacterized protein (TIGR02147 family)
VKNQIFKSVFEYDDYKQFVVDRIQSLPRRGFGQLTRLAASLDSSPVVLSQILRGKRELSLDQALVTADFLSLDQVESKAFMILVEMGQARTPRLKRHLQKQFDSLKADFENLSSRVFADKELSENDKAIFYSDWSYSAIRLVSTLKTVNSVEDICRLLDLSPPQVSEALSFLLSTGLLVKVGSRWTLGSQSTHLKSDSPWIKNRQTDWRLKAIEKMRKNQAQDLFYTSTASLSKKDFTELREELVKTIQAYVQRATKSQEEMLVSFNLDLFRVDAESIQHR